MSTTAVKGSKPRTLFVRGQLWFDYNLPAGEIVVRACSRAFGSVDNVLAETLSDTRGSFELSYTLDGASVNLEIQTLDRRRNPIPLSATLVGTTSDQELNLVVPGFVRPLEPEFDRLADDLEGAIGGIAQLARAGQDGRDADLSLLSAAVLWNVKVLEVARAAVQISDETKVHVAAIYGLLRSGLPANARTLASTDPNLMRDILARADSGGLIKAGTREIEAAVAAFVEFAKTARHDTKATGAVSTVGELIAASGLPKTQQAVWEEIFFTTPREQLWEVAAAKLPATSVAKLQVQGKLAALTINNAPLSAAVAKEIGPKGELTALVDSGYYSPDAWRKKLASLADNPEALDAIVPPAYPGKTPAERADAYAEDLGRRVALAFPTHMIGHLLESGDLPLGDEAAEVGAFLKKAAAQGFELGRTPIEPFLEPEKPTKPERPAKPNRPKPRRTT